MATPEGYLSAPIPGQSLTATPKQYAWERPPQIADYEEATKYYIDRLASKDVMDDLSVVFDGGMPISAFVEALTTTGVSEGLHTIDVSLIISPVLHAFVKAAMLQYGIDAKDEVYDPKKDPSEREKMRLKTAINLALAEAKTEDRTAATDPGVAMLQKIKDNMEGDTSEDEGILAMAEGQEEPEMPEAEEVMTEEAPAPRGLMAREGM